MLHKLHIRDQIYWACAAQSKEMLPKAHKPKGEFKNQMKSSHGFKWKEKEK